MKRLLCIVGDMNPGGAETFLMKLYRNLDRTRYQMDFCTSVVEKQFYEDEILSLGGRMFRIPCKTVDILGFRKGLFDVVKNNGYEYVLRITANAMAFWDMKIAHDAGAKVCAVRSSNSSDGAGWKWKIAHFVGKLLFSKYITCRIAPSDLAAIYTFGRKAYEAGAVHMLHNAVDLGVYKFDASDRDAIRAEFGLPADVKVVGHVGRFTEQKNHRYLLKIFASLADGDPNVRLMLVGAGELMDDIRSEIANLGLNDRVIIAGIRRDVPKMLSAMDVFVFPSLYEGMPNTVIEAQATSLPCVIADTITREANVTGRVKHLPIDDHAVPMWIDEIQRALSVPRRDTRDDFVRNGYDIVSATEMFQRIIFEG